MSAIDDLYIRIGERIKQAREERGWTQAQLGEALGYSQAAVGNYELGRRQVGIDDLYRIAEALNKPYSFFLGVDRQVEEETKREVEQRVRRDMADFVGVRMLPVITEPVAHDIPLDPSQVASMMPIARELVPEADLIFRVTSSGGSLSQGDCVLIGRATRPVPGEVYVLYSDQQPSLCALTAGLDFEPLAGAPPLRSFILLGRFCGLITTSPWALGEHRPVPASPPLWEDLDPADQQQVQQFVEFLRGKRGSKPQ